MTRRKQGAPMSPEEAVELSRLLDKLDMINLDTVMQEKLDKLTPVEKMIKDLREDRKVVRKIRGTRTKMHWKKRKRLRREYHRDHVRMKRKIEKADLLASGPEGWYQHLREFWWRKKIDVEMTKEQFIEILWPALEGEVPVFRRYNTSGPIALGNIYVVASGTKDVIWDGKEWEMKQMGYLAE